MIVPLGVKLFLLMVLALAILLDMDSCTSGGSLMGETWFWVFQGCAVLACIILILLDVLKDEDRDGEE